MSDAASDTTPSGSPQPGTATPPSTPSTARRLGAAVGRAAGSAARGTREVIRRHPTANRVYRTGVGVVGGGTVALGVVMMPLPGPGALVALGGLGILATEFEGAKTVSRHANRLAKRGFDAAKRARDRRRNADSSGSSPVAGDGGGSTSPAGS